MEFLRGLGSSSFWTPETKRNIKSLKVSGNLKKLMNDKELSLRDVSQLAVKAFKSPMSFEPGQRQEIIDQLKTELEAQKSAQPKDNTETKLSKNGFFERKMNFLKKDPAAEHQKIEADIQMLESIAETSRDSDFLATAKRDLEQLHRSFFTIDDRDGKTSLLEELEKIDTAFQKQLIINVHSTEYKKVKALLQELKPKVISVYRGQDADLISKTTTEVNRRLKELNPGNGEQVLQQLKEIQRNLNEQIIDQTSPAYKDVADNLENAIDELNKLVKSKDIKTKNQNESDQQILEKAEEAVDAVAARLVDPKQRESVMGDLMEIQQHLNEDIHTKGETFQKLDKRIDDTLIAIKEAINQEKMGKKEALTQSLSSKLKEAVIKEGDLNFKVEFMQDLVALGDIKNYFEAAGNKRAANSIERIIKGIQDHPNYKLITK